MKNKEKKFKSQKSVLILLQQLQTKYYNKCAFHIDTYESGSIDVYIVIPYDDGLFEFSEVDDCNVWKATYKELLSFLKRLDYEEQE